jgi:hypothetical protein
VTRMPGSRGGRLEAMEPRVTFGVDCLEFMVTPSLPPTGFACGVASMPYFENLTFVGIFLRLLRDEVFAPWAGRDRLAMTTA